MRNLFKKVNQEHKGTEEGFGSFLGKAEKEYRAKLKKEIKGQALELPAPAFSLKDLDGNTVSLSDYKDKIVVLDFWATWCVRSFPAMQKSVNKYRDDDNVEFLFIDTWENGKDVEKNVRKIIGKNNYPFHVLMDVDGSMTDAYKVFALPTKMIIGPGGNIRFRIRGFDSDSQLIEELDLMIAMLR